MFAAQWASGRAAVDALGTSLRCSRLLSLDNQLRVLPPYLLSSIAQSDSSRLRKLVPVFQIPHFPSNRIWPLASDIYGSGVVYSALSLTFRNESAPVKTTACCEPESNVRSAADFPVCVRATPDGYLDRSIDICRFGKFFMETGQLRYATDRVISSARHKDFDSQNLFDYILRRALSDALQSSA